MVETPWLHYRLDEWPRSELLVNKEVLKEERKEIVSSVVNFQSAGKSFIYKFSSYIKLIRIIAWLLRFVNNCRILNDKRKYGNLDSQEIFVAECTVIRIIQKENFVNEQDEELKTLGAFKDKNDFIQLKTKILYRLE